MRGTVSHNIRFLYVVSALQHALVYLPIWILYLAERGLPLTTIFLLDSIRSITFILLELPSGAFSDRFGRKFTLLISSTCGVLSMAFLGLGVHVWHYVVAVIFSGAFVSFHSGTMQALTYDSLEALRQQERSPFVFSRQQMLQSLAQATASIIGGIVAFWSLRYAVLATLPFMVALLLTTMLLVEPPHKSIEHTPAPLWRRCGLLLLHTPLLILLLLFHSIAGGGINWLSRLAPPYLALLAVSPVLIGFFFAILDVAIAVGAALVPWLLRHCGRYRTLIIATLLFVVSALLLGLPASLFGSVFIVFAHMAWGILKPVTTDAITSRTTTDVRATILSLQSFGFHLVYAVIAVPLGVAAETISLPMALLFLGIGAGITLLLVVTRLSRIDRLGQKSVLP